MASVQEKVDPVHNRTNATGGASMYALDRRLLAGRALANFNHAATTYGNKSLANHTRCIQEVTSIPLEGPSRPETVDETLSEETKGHADARLYRPSHQYQRLSRRILSCGNTTKLLDNKLLDLLEFGIPIKWHRKMQVQHFEPTARTLQNFQDFCKRLESALDEPSHG